MQTISPQELSAKLQAKLQADHQAVEDLTRTQLEQHARRLKRLSSDALTTTKNVIQHHDQSLNKLHQATLERLKWLMLWPLLASICLSLVIVAGASLWSWWKLGQVDDQVQQKFKQIRQIEAEFCASPAGQRVCKKG